jgi:Kdo2-lipid IVA lauroyltransferase/acyltransferase
MKFLIGLFARLPLPANHAFGAWLGRLVHRLSPRYRTRIEANLSLYCKHAGLDASNQAALGAQAVREAGKGFTELAVAWMAPVDEAYALVRACTGWEHVEAALARGKGIIFVTPHLGCYDIAGRYLESRLPVLALYRPPKVKWLEPVMQAGRVRGEGATAQANTGGVRTLLKTLKQGGNIIVLPDQVPAAEQGGEGVWVDFFGKPAYTMTLLGRLARSTDATVLYFFGERLAGGKGYHVRIEPMTEPYSEDKAVSARQTNAMVEKLVAMAPAQYLWGYNRYKHPAGAPLPPNSSSSPSPASSDS